MLLNELKYIISSNKSVFSTLIWKRIQYLAKKKEYAYSKIIYDSPSNKLKDHGNKTKWWFYYKKRKTFLLLKMVLSF